MPGIYSKSTAIYVHKAEDVPEVEHWAILESNSVHIPGDERSRTNPGHGYPAHNEEFVSYVAYTKKEEFEAEFKRKLAESRTFMGRAVRAVHVIPIVAKTTITLEDSNARND